MHSKQVNVKQRQVIQVKIQSIQLIYKAMLN